MTDIGPEVRGEFYVRQPVTWRDGVNVEDLEFVPGEGEIGGLAYWDGLEGDVMQGCGLTQRRRVAAGQTYIIPAGSLQIRVKGIEGAALRAVQDTLAVQYRYVSVHRVGGQADG